MGRVRRNTYRPLNTRLLSSTAAIHDNYVPDDGGSANSRVTAITKLSAQTGNNNPRATPVVRSYEERERERARRGHEVEDRSPRTRRSRIYDLVATMPNLSECAPGCWPSSSGVRTQQTKRWEETLLGRVVGTNTNLR